MDFKKKFLEMLTEQIKREIEAELHHCVQRHCGCLDALHIVREHYGWISDENIRELAQFLQLTPDELDGAATFYNHLYRRPVGRHVILVCDSVSCWITGYENVREYLTKRLGIGLGETSTDGRFTLLPIQCLGACDRAPAMMVDADLHTDLDAEKIDKILEEYQ